MYIDFIELNKYCLKDCYTLPSIEYKVVAIVGYEVLSFLDLYKENHQVLMDPDNVEKTTFVIDWGVAPTRRCLLA